jgi:hypothetical protein
MAGSSVNGTLYLTILEASNLKVSNLTTTMDPYCVVEFQSKTYQTEYCKNGDKNPTWHETLKIPVSGVNLDQNITFYIYDKEMIKDNKIGKAELSLQELAKCCKAEKECDVHLKTFGLMANGEPAGVLRVRPCFSGSGFPGCGQQSTPTNIDQKCSIGQESTGKGTTKSSMAQGEMGQREGGVGQGGVSQASSSSGMGTHGGGIQQPKQGGHKLGQHESGGEYEAQGVGRVEKPQVQSSQDV